MRSRDEIYRGIIILMWSTVVLITAYILTQNGIVIESEEEYLEIEKEGFLDNIVTDLGSYLTKKSIALADYMTDKNYTAMPENHIIKYLIKSSPISMYVLAHGKTQLTVENDWNSYANKIIINKNLVNNQTTDAPVGYVFGESYMEDLEEEKIDKETKEVINTNRNKFDKLKKELTTDSLLNRYYTVDATTSVDRKIFNIKELLEKDFAISKNKDKPQILIYHTHATSEAFANSRPGKTEDTVVGVGACLEKILRKKYGYNVIHDKTEYDKVNGRTDRNKAYTQALTSLKKILDKNPTIEVVIDIHRDGVPGTKKRVVTINGKKTAQIMFFNGLSRNQKGPIDYLSNPNLQNNLAFSLQLKIKAMEKYPDFTRANFLKGYLYNMHLRGKSLLIELGNQNNTVEEAKNAMEPLADILNQTLSGN
jgi:stage II sporulation protein P